MGEPKRRITAIGLVAGGALTSGAASVAGLAVATRALGPDRVGPLAVAWGLAVVVGPGLWWSVEQEAARATAGGEGTAAVVGLVVRRAVLAASVVAAAGMLGRNSVFRGSTAVPLALALVAAAYGPLYLAWGRLAGEGRSRALAASVTVEGMARLVLVGGTAAVTDDVGASAVALSAAVLLAAVVAVRRMSTRGPDGGWASGGSVGRAADRRTMAYRRTMAAGRVRVAGRVRALTWAGLLSQGLFLTSPAMFELLAPARDPRTARLAMAVLLARAPALAWKGVLAAVVPAVVADPGSPERASAAVARAAVIAAVLAGAVGSAVAVVAGEQVLDLLTGPAPHLGSGALALLAATTAAYLGALTVTAALAGAGRARAAAAAWFVGVATSAAVVSIPGDALRRVVTALAAGTLIALAGLVWAGRRPPPRPADQRTRPDPASSAG